MCIPIVERLTQADADESLQFLEKMSEKVKGNTEAFVMAKILMGRIHLLSGDLPKTKVIFQDLSGRMLKAPALYSSDLHFLLKARCAF